jgi:hypothetical protein
MARIIFDDALYEVVGIDVGRADRKARGGTSGQRGYDYQRDYALYVLLEHAAQDDARAEFAVCEQVSKCLVDDVVIDDGECAIFCQIKQEAGLTWTQDGAALAKDFEDQLRLCEQSGTQARLRLVVHEAARAVLLRDKIPATLAAVAEVVHFPDCMPRSSIWSEPESVWFDPLRTLCAVVDSPSAREAIFVWGRQALSEARDQDGFTTVRALLDYIARGRYVAVRRPWVVEPQRWSLVCAALARLEGFTLYLQGGEVLWEMVHGDGSVEQGMIGAADSAGWEGFADAALATPPLDMDSFWDILP